MIKGKDGAFKRVSWDEALDTAAGKLQQIKADHGARAVAATVGSIGAEDILISAFAQRWRGAFGTPNFFSVEGNCFRCRIMARLFTFGNYPVSDIDHADLLILWGKNPDGSEPPVGARIHKMIDDGLKVIVIDPLKTRLAKRGLHIPITPGTDAALALAMIHVIISEGLYDKDFVEKHTLGFDQLAEHVKNYAPEKVAEICGIARRRYLHDQSDVCRRRPGQHQAGHRLHGSACQWVPDLSRHGHFAGHHRELCRARRMGADPRCCGCRIFAFRWRESPSGRRNTPFSIPSGARPRHTGNKCCCRSKSSAKNPIPSRPFWSAAGIRWPRGRMRESCAGRSPNSICSWLPSCS